MSAETGLLTRDSKGKGRDVDREQIAREVLAAVGGKENVVANDICMTRLRILTEDPTLVDTDKLSSARGVLGFVRRGTNGIEVVFSPGKVEAVHEAIVRLTGIEGDEEVFAEIGSKPAANKIHVHISQNPLLDAARIQSDREAEESGSTGSVEDLVSLLDTIADNDSGSERLDFEDETFDVVISRNLTWTLPDTARAYKDWLRVLKKGGILLNFDANYGAVNFADTSKLPKNHTHNKLGLDMMAECEEIKRQLPISSRVRPAWDVETLGNLGVEQLSVDFGVSRKIYTVKDEFYNPDALFALFAVKA